MARPTLTQRLAMCDEACANWKMEADMAEAYYKALEQHLRVHGCRCDFVEVANEPERKHRSRKVHAV